MSIFNDHINNEISMREMFKITSFSYFNNNEGLISVTNGNPLNLHNVNWVFPEQNLCDIEPKRYEALVKQYCNVRWGEAIPVSYQYQFNPEGFSCTCDGDRLWLYSDDIIKNEYCDLKSKNPESFASIMLNMLNEALRLTKVDELFTPDVFGADPEETIIDLGRFAWLDKQYNVKTYSKYWLSVCDKLSKTIREMVSPKLKIDINLAINNSRSTQYSTCLICYFRFLSYENNPLYWFYIDRAHCWLLDPLKKNFYMKTPSNIAPCFNFCADLVIKQ